MVKVDNHWLFGDVTVQIRNKPRFKLVIRQPVPWDKRNPDYTEAIIGRPALHTATLAFGAASSKTKGVKLWLRKELIRQAVKGQKYGGKERAPSVGLTEAEFKQRLAEMSTAIAEARQKAERIRAERLRQVVTA